MGILLYYVKQEPDYLVPKYPSDTKWSARADATEAVFRGYKQFQSALQKIATNDNQTGDTLTQHSLTMARMCVLIIFFSLSFSY